MSGCIIIWAGFLLTDEEISIKNALTYSGISPLGTTILRVSCMRLYFIILSADVVEVSEGEAFT